GRDRLERGGPRADQAGQLGVDLVRAAGVGVVGIAGAAVAPLAVDQDAVLDDAREAEVVAAEGDRHELRPQGSDQLSLVARLVVVVRAAALVAPGVHGLARRGDVVRDRGVTVRLPVAGARRELALRAAGRRRRVVHGSVVGRDGDVGHGAGDGLEV